MKKLFFRQNSLQDEKGIALLLALFCVIIISFLAVEISFDTSVEYVLANKEYHREKAYAAARAGVEMSLLRIQLFKNITAQYGAQLKGQTAITQMIWSFPFTWPPAIPTTASIVDKDQTTTAIGASLMDAHYAATITSEGAKFDINDLDSPSDALKKATRQELLQIFEDRKINDHEWEEKHRNFNAEELVNSIQDWISDGNISLNGGDKRSKYQELNKDGNDSIPPNHPFQTFDELKMVYGMTDELFQMLLPHITVYGIKAINVNQADKEVLKAIDPILNNEEIVTKVIDRRNDPDKGGPFKDDNDLVGFIGANAQNFNPSKIPLYYGNEYNFRIRSIGEFGNVTREIVAIVYDVTAVQAQLKKIIDAETAAANPQTPPVNGAATPPTTATQPPAAQAQLSTEKPRIVYWWEN